MDEVSMVEFESTRGTSSNAHAGASSGFFGEAYGSGSDDEDGAGPQGVECKTH